MADTEAHPEPQGTLVTRTLAMPADTNPNGDIFGGWLLGQMDIAGATRALEIAHGRIATVAVDAMAFHQPVFVGDIVGCYASLLRVGRTSMTVRVEAWASRREGGPAIQVTSGTFTYVAIGEDRRPRPVSSGAAPAPAAPAT